MNLDLEKLNHHTLAKQVVRAIRHQIFSGALKPDERVVEAEIAAGMVKSKLHLGVRAIHAAEPGDVIIIDNRGDLYNNCWGEILAMGAKMKGVAGVVVDGAARTPVGQVV
jgi:hypothetical protein